MDIMRTTPYSWPPSKQGPAKIFHFIKKHSLWGQNIDPLPVAFCGAGNEYWRGGPDGYENPTLEQAILDGGRACRRCLTLTKVSPLTSVLY